MIVSRVTDPLLRQALRGAAHPEEEVVVDADLATEALQWGFPRLLVRAGAATQDRQPTDLRVLDLDDVMLRRWEAERRAADLPAPRLDHLVRRLQGLVERSASERTWVDSALADLSRAAGQPLPFPFRALARRVLEFPRRYTSLDDLAGACGLSHGALKARFRRRALASPYTYLRWFRVIAVAQVLSDRRVTVAQAAHRIGFTSAGNLCRTTATLIGTTPTELRTVRGWNRLVVQFAWIHLTPDALQAWTTLTELFSQRRVA
jgi:AraC-like DNA-binding protein